VTVFLTGMAELQRERDLTDPDWLARFHRGDRDAVEACYRECFASVQRVVERLVGGHDAETVIHEVFFRLLSEPEVRRSFRGGSMVAWLTTMAKNRAIDRLRERKHEVPLPERLPDSGDVGPAAGDTGGWEQALDARRLVARFTSEVLPPRWRAVFDVRFLEQLDQRSAAARLGISRTTLAYQEFRIRRLLRRFLLRTAGRSTP
jgi:RNA polymerase sigma-70 factor (ECF subfamily)